MRAVATPGRWIWRASGLITTAVLVLVGAYLATRAGQPEYAQPQATAIRTVTVPQPVTSLTVQSYGAPVQITAGRVGRVQITETIMYDSPGGTVSAVPQPASAGPLSASPAVPAVPSAPAVPAVPSALGGPLSGAPAVVQSVSGGRLSLGDPACADSDCSVSFALTVPSDVTATVRTDGGSVSVSGIAGANLDSGGGPVRVRKIGGPLTVDTDGGSLQLDGLAGPPPVDHRLAKACAARRGRRASSGTRNSAGPAGAGAPGT